MFLNFYLRNILNAELLLITLYFYTVLFTFTEISEYYFHH